MKMKIPFVIAAILFLALTSCENLKDTYNDFVKDGETNYIAKADTIKVRAGKNRIEVSWLLFTDPNVSKYKISWGTNKSVEGSVQKTNNVDTVRVMLNNMEEDTYQFDIILYDQYGHSSVKASTIGKVYGARYQKTLLDRFYKTVSRLNARDIEIVWAGASAGMSDVQLEYMDRTNVLRRAILPDSVSIITVEDFPIDGMLKYRTSFIPEKNALDTFYTDYQSIPDPFFEIPCDKSLWTNANLSDDSNRPLYSSNALENLWDEDRSATPYFIMNYNLDPPYVLPCWFTINLGMKYKLTKIRVNQLNHSASWIFNGASPRTFEIYATNTPTTNWDDWTLVGAFESVKPSGAALGTNTPEDLAVNLAGETFAFTPKTVDFQYIRFKTLSTWRDFVAAGVNQQVSILELTFWGQPVD